MRLRLLYCLLALAGWVSGGGAAAEENAASKKDAPDPAQSSYIEQVNVSLAMVEVVVLDSKGQHIHGLPASAFQLKEGRRPVRLITFDEIDLNPDRASSQRETVVRIVPDPVEATAGGDGGPPPTAPAPPVSAGATARERQDGDRWFVMLFDGYNNPSALRISRARKAAKKWMRENLRQGDRVAVYQILPELFNVKGFSSSATALSEAIDDIRIMPASDMGQEMLETKVEGVDRLTEEFAHQQLRNAATFGATLSMRERDQFYQSISSLAQAIAPLKGSKSILLFSGGFPITRTWATNATGGLTPRFKEMLDALTWYGIRVFSFDTGEEGGFTGAEKAGNFRQSIDQLGLGAEWADDLQVGAQIDALHAHHEILAVLGNETGGRFQKGKDFDKALDNVDDDLTHYYLLGYEPVDPTRYQKFVPLSVKIPGVKRAKAIARRGRFLRPVKAARAAEEEARTPQRIPEVLPALSLSGRAVFHRYSDQKTLVTLPVHVSGQALENLANAAATEVLDLTVEIKASVSGLKIEQMERKVSVPLGPEALKRLKDGIWLREALVLPATNLELEVRIRAEGIGLGRWREIVQVPAFPASRFALAGLVVFSAQDTSLPVFDVFHSKQPVPGTQPVVALTDPLGPGQGRPPMLTHGQLPRDLPLLVQVSVVSPPPPGQGESNLRLDWELVPATGEPLAPPVRYRRLELVDDKTRLDVVADLDLTQVPPGKYLLRLSAADRHGAGRSVQELELSLKP